VDRRIHFAASTIAAGPGIDVRRTISIGIALFRGAEEPIEAALLRADAALYEAKRGGRNRVVSAEPLAEPHTAD
jgi:PleD family two-component response regulator